MSLFRHQKSHFETYLMFDAGDMSGAGLRKRAIYVLAWSTVVLQIVNFAAITAFKSVASVEALVCLAVIAAALLAIVSLRSARDLTPYAAGAALFGIGAPIATAVYDFTGINTALLPLVVATPMIVAFTGQVRIAIAAGVGGLAVIALLYGVSAHAPNAAAQDADAILQRAIHAAGAIFLVTVTSVFVAAGAYSTLRILEERTARAVKAEAAKTEFLATMSHELRTPMNGVLGLAEALVREARDPEMRETAETISRSGHALLRILNDILDLSKIEAQKVDLILEPFSPRALARNVVSQWRQTAAQKQIRIEATVDAETPDYLKGDALRIEQILSNLVSNAVKFTPAGLVSVALSSQRQPDGDVTLRAVVRDSGPGVPAEARERIFAPFEQADAGVTRAHGGTGLGLAISRKLAGLMGGALTLEGEGPDQAFVFEADFAVADEPQVQASVTARGAPLRVLVVDDNTVNRLVAARLLGLLGHTATLAESGEECFGALQRGDFDVILLDKNMPCLSGPEVVARLRAEGGPGALTPVIACTADTMGDERDKLLNAGFDGYLAKPVSVAALRAAIDDVMREDRLRAPIPLSRALQGTQALQAETPKVLQG